MTDEMLIVGGKVVRITLHSEGDIEVIAFRELGKRIQVRNEGGRLIIEPMPEQKVNGNE